MNDTRVKMIEAIARQLVVTASYNGNVMKLAPHQMFERRGDLFVSALNMSKNWRSTDDYRLGHFKLDGLNAAELIEEEFAPLPSYEPTPPLPEDILILSV